MTRIPLRLILALFLTVAVLMYIVLRIHTEMQYQAALMMLTALPIR